MEPQTYDQLAEIEDHHWWHRSRMKLVSQHIERMHLPSDARILDVGCGTGGTTRFLQRFGQVTGIDKSALAISYAERKADAATIVQGDVNQLDELVPAESFDLVTLFNVLYHRWIPDDISMLRRIRRVLRPGGHVLLTEPAYKVLMRKHDDQDFGKTRYRLGEFKKYFARVGLCYRWGHYFNAVSFPICLFMALKHRSGGSNGSAPEVVQEAEVPPAALNRAMELYMSCERFFSRLVPLPIGVTLLAVGRKDTAS